MATGHLKRPSCQNGEAITRRLHGRFEPLASDVYARSGSLGCLRPMRRSSHSPVTAPSRDLPTREPREDGGGGLLAPLTVRLERFQAGALRNCPALHVPPERHEQATGQGHATHAPHALASQSKPGMAPDAEGSVGVIA
jgi:hypothetical protein